MKFKRIYVEICNTCNLSCSFCASRPAHPRQMSVEQFADIVEQVRPYTDHLYLHLLGEPLMHPQLEAILQICQRASLHVQLTTNGTLLASRRELLEAYPPRQINISVHSFWEQPRDLCANYLEQVLTCGDALSAHSYISYRLWQVEEGEDPKTQTLLRAICAYYEMPLPERLQGSLRLADRRFLSFERAFEWPSLQRPVRAQRGRCRGLVDMLAIRSNGEVVPCCLDAHGQEVLGNVFEERFADILEKPYTLLLRQGMQQGLLRSPLCQRCTYRQRFD